MSHLFKFFLIRAGSKREHIESAMKLLAFVCLIAKVGSAVTSDEDSSAPYVLISTAGPVQADNIVLVRAPPLDDVNVVILFLFLLCLI